MKSIVNPEQADEWVKTYDYGKTHMATVMRPINQKHVEFLASEMLKGRFQDHARIEFADCAENGRRYIVNGNHTLRAIVLAGRPQRVTVEYVQCPTMGEVRVRYATYDINRVRNRADSLRAYDAIAMFGADAQSNYVKQLSAAVGFIMDGFVKSSIKRSTADILVAMNPWAEAYTALVGVVGKSSRGQRITNRRAVLAVALVTMRYQPELAARFWRDVADGAGLKIKSPAWQLREYLSEATMIGGPIPNGVEIAVMAKTVAYCWNKYFEGMQTIDRMSVPLDKPISILGAPEIPVYRPVNLDELRGSVAA